MILTWCVVIAALAAGLANAEFYGSGTVGSSCTFNTDCITQPAMYCNVGACACYGDYIAYQGYCYAKIEPQETGCAYDFQCEAVWPGATCTGSSGGTATNGMCDCPATEIAKTTRDGTVCVNAAAGIGCPLPEGQFVSPLTVLNGYPATGPSPITCLPTAPEGTVGLDTGLCAYTSAAGVVTDVSDLYDCIELNPLGFPGAPVGVCCPDRAFTCIQPQLTAASAVSATTETRYWYNSVTGGCQSFLFDTMAILPTSPNNFRTLAQCQSYCGGVCDRGSPYYDIPTTSTDVRDETPETCTYTTDCTDSTDYQCEKVASFSYCCPTVAYNCGAYGGLPDLTQALPNVGFASYSQPVSTTRYYYDSTTQTCKQFTYLGNGGNYNNFLSISDCQTYCQATFCTQGNPLKDAVGNILSCGSTNSCPSTHTCYNSRCCPKPRFVCQQTKQAGDGTSTTNIRYWWNQYTRQCEELLFTGQNGNDNNFLTLTACQSYCSNIRIAPQCQVGQALVDGSDQYAVCGTSTATACGTNYACYFDGFVYGCCPTQAYVCGITYSSGIVCNGPASTRYYFNTVTQTCSSFTFNGCDGNPNNFMDLTTCNNYCGAGGCPFGGTPYQASSTSAFQTCTTTSDCVGNYECDTVTVGTTTTNYCCPSRAYICQQSVYSGANCGTASLSRWVYRYTTGTCETYTFTGCAGTSNTFATQQDCQAFCGSTACLPGEVARSDAYGASLTCTSDANCGTGYKCRFDTLTSQSYCCGSDAAGVCNTDQRAYIDPTTDAPKQCIPSAGATACYSGYGCQLNSVLGKYYCCAPLNGTYCPTNRAPYTLNGVVQPCSLYSTGVCLTGYSCQTYAASSFVSYTGYCCTSTDVCPNGGDYYRETSGTLIGSARACTVGGVACPTGYYCGTLSGATTGYCCNGGAAAENGGCPTGQYIQITSTSPKTYGTCNPFNGQLNGGCSSSSYPSCQWSVLQQMYVCCGTTAIVPTTTGGCPGNQVALLSGSSVVTCTSNAQCTSVLAGYFCQYSTANARLQCCGVKGTCTGTAVAYVDANGNTVSCTVDSQCTTYGNFRCLAGNCCSGGAATGCTTSQILFNGQCVAIGLFIGQSCVTTAQCTGSTGSQCISGFCSCPSGTTNSGNQCISGAQIGQACNVATPGQCQGGSTCVNGICTCPAGQTNQANVCRATGGTAPTCKTVGQTAIMINGAAQNCLTTNCPAGTLCEWNSIYNGGQYICCGGGTTTTTTGNRCASTEVEQTSRASCLAPATCPGGYTCKYSAVALTYICCAPATAVAANPATSSSCGTGMVEQTGTPNCLQTYCANGYTCTYTGATTGYRCCTKSSAATNNQADQSVSTTCTGAFLSYYNTNTGVPCNVDNDCVGTQYPRCLKSNSAGYKVCCASGGTQSYGK